MARKGNQQKNSIDHHSSSQKKRGSDSGSAVPVNKGRGKKAEIKVFPGEELPNCNHIGDRVGERQSNACHSGHGNFENLNSGVFLETENKGTDVRGELEESVPSKSNLIDHGLGEQNDGRDSRGAKSGLGCLVNGVDVNNVMENVKLSYNELVRNLKVHVESMSKAAMEFLERRKPLYVSLMTKLHSAHDYARRKIWQVYPVVLNFLMHFLNILLLLSMIWLDCSLRGVDSFLRMGTTSFFSVIWCSILSMTAMVGMFKFLIVLGIAALLAFVIGFTIAVIAVAIFGIVLLWIYGSFWTTMLVVFLGGLVFKLHHERLALLMTSTYAIYSAWNYVGWLGLVLAMNLSFISSDALIYFLKNNVNQQRGPNETAGFNTEAGHPSSFDSGNTQGFSADRSAGVPSTSGADSETTSEDEVVRLLNCTDHYSALGFTRYENVDVSLLKREYRKKAMLVHPDKNMGNEKAAEAFKKLQNAYEVLLDSLKRKTYDDELRREELLDCFRRFQTASQKNGRNGFFASGHTRPEGDGKDIIGDSRRIACKKCSNFHVWIQIKRSKSRARWCQECNDYHQAKDGDGWVEQSSQPLLFGLFQKVDLPSAYVCANSKIYDATEWYICQGMRCPPNTHKPSFHVNTSITSKHNAAGNKGTSSGQRGGRMPPTDFEENMTEEEFLEWLQNAVQSGLFDNVGEPASAGSPSGAKAGSGSKSGGTSSGNKKKKKGKRQW